MTRRAIRVFWGRRPESVPAVASRWRRTLEQVEFLLPEVVGGSWQQIHSAGPATAVTVDQLAQVLENAQAAEDWSDRLGIGLRLASSGGPEWGFELSGLAGGEPEIVLQSMIIAVSAPDAPKFLRQNYFGCSPRCGNRTSGTSPTTTSSTLSKTSPTIASEIP